MRATSAYMLAVLLLVGSSHARSQISPGELTAPHAQLEGIDNCTACHTLGKKVEAQNCLTCHTELRTRIDAGRGYHATVKDRACVQCHKEHHGRNFTLVRLDKAAFDHRAVGFALTGKHRAINCEKCHTERHVAARDIRANASLLRSGTYLGLTQDCSSCHADVHRGQMAGTCSGCHTTDAWKPAPGFRHDRTKFALTGRHESVSCQKCHRASGDSQSGTVLFALGRFSSCSDCHVDVHRGKFTEGCASCHVTDGWKRGASTKFNHATTRFPLRGKHADVACERCHRPAPGGMARLPITRFQRCADCHADPHAGQFASTKGGGRCESCHVEAGWREGPIKSFDHATTKFALRGKHRDVRCAECHVIGPSAPRSARSVASRKFSACIECHTDIHRGQFATTSLGSKCERCHSENGFLPPAYSGSDHAVARFVLGGAHLAVACVQCHKPVTAGGQSLRQYHWDEVPRCRSCHTDIHRGAFAKWDADGCATCHETRAWNSVRFSHERTGYPLKGGHVSVPCSGCHRTGTGQSSRWMFAGTTTKCKDCHVSGDLTVGGGG